MVNSTGIRRGTRYLFARRFRARGLRPLGALQKTYRRGDIVDIRGDGGYQKGLPHKVFHGKTGVVFNVTKRSVGVFVTKQVRNRIVEKRVILRVEHVKPSKCRMDFLRRVKENDTKKIEAAATGQRVASMKRLPDQPKTAHLVKTRTNAPQTLAPLRFEIVA